MILQKGEYIMLHFLSFRFLTFCGGILFTLISVSCVHAPEFSPIKESKSKETSSSINEGIAEIQKARIDEQYYLGLDLSQKEAIEIKNLPQPMSLSNHDLLKVPTKGQFLVDKWIHYFQGRGRKHMERYLSRLGRYQSYMTEVLKQEGLPKDLIYVALIESGFNQHAYSSASAVGYWQFIRGTGRGYGLKINSLVDERKNPEKATRAAARYFKSLYKAFESWPLVLASYNAGEHRVLRAIMRNHTRNFWTLALEKQLPKETRNYVPKFIAAVTICKDPKAYDFSDVEPAKPLLYDLVTLKKGISISKMAKNLGVSKKNLKKLNPSFRTDFVPIYRGKSIVFRVPHGYGQKAIPAAKLSISKNKYYTYEGNSLHRVRRGDSLYRIARRYGTNVRALQLKNNLSRRSVIYPGMKIRIPGRAKKVAQSSSKSYSGKIYKIRAGDTLSEIAEKYKVGLSRLAKLNGLSLRTHLRIGQKIKIPK